MNIMKCMLSVVKDCRTRSKAWWFRANTRQGLGVRLFLSLYDQKQNVRAMRVIKV